ncbi:MAG: LEA type 2 family protein [Woeseiaceae bacterium]|nr:LEA type 2 family protein [Woeseiaceae bacterium]
MVRHATIKSATLIATAALLVSCAAMEELVDPPRVSLRSVEVQQLDVRKQTFLLSFDVTNPGPVSLPVKSVSYDVRLDGYRFASGETPGSFTIPAASDTGFAISAELDLLSTAPALLSIVREATRRDIPYELHGSLAIDLPLVRPVAFESGGQIRLTSSGF